MDYASGDEHQVVCYRDEGTLENSSRVPSRMNADAATGKDQENINVLHITMHFDNCCKSHDGAVRPNFLFLMLSSFPANMRKLAYSLWRSLQASDNSLVNAVLASDLFLLSSVFQRWRSILF